MRVITLNSVIEILTVYVRDAVKMRIIAVIDLADHLPIGGHLVCTDRDGVMQPNALNGLV